MNNCEHDQHANLEINAETAELIDAGKSDSEIALYLNLGAEVMRFAEAENITQTDARKVAAKLLRGAKK